jgi:hypothetical protein
MNIMKKIAVFIFLITIIHRLPAQNISNAFREEIRNRIVQKAINDLQIVINAARDGKNIPDDLLLLIDYQDKDKLARTFLSKYNSRQEMLDYIESKYKNIVFSMLGLTRVSNAEFIENLLRTKNNITFHLVDDNATADFDTYYKNYPDSTFDQYGNLIAKSIIPQDTKIIGYYNLDKYGLEELNKYIAIKTNAILNGNHILNVSLEASNEKSEVTFFLDKTGSDMFYEFTSKNIGRSVVIVYDNKIHFIGAIQSAIMAAVRLSF